MPFDNDNSRDKCLQKLVFILQNFQMRIFAKIKSKL